MAIDYYSKYLKYKNKYVTLKAPCSANLKTPRGLKILTLALAKSS